jgi:catechol 2,3-dioxygenase-like lactoylglutathione lyase family enzyme
MVDSVRAIGIYTTDLDRSTLFYKDVLGFELVTLIPPAIAIMKSGNVNLYIESGYNPDQEQKDKTRSSVFLEISIPAKQAFESLKADGVRLLQDSPEQLGDDVWWFQFCDPDGNILEFTSKQLEAEK